jgi:predicted extracellular nuclease
MKIIRLYILFSAICIAMAACVFVSCKTKAPAATSSEDSVMAGDRNGYRLMFYNTENYFDVFDDSLTSDEDFTPEGNMHWSWDKYRQKQRNIYKVMMALGGWEPPDIAGFCEVENRFVMNDLIKNTPLGGLGYQLIHYESRDPRGIDVALIYRKDKFTPVKSYPIQVNFPFDTARRTRDILFVEGITHGKDTLNIFINHWPSRRGGQLESDQYREYTASVLRSSVDSLFKNQPHCFVVIMGDFNDEPENTSIIDGLKTKSDYDQPVENEIYNLSWYLKVKKNQGSHKFQGEWGILDQIMVSGTLLTGKYRLYTSTDNVHIFKTDFLLEKDEPNVGYKPFRTYVGFKYNGGYSDHLPVYIDLVRK